MTVTTALPADCETVAFYSAALPLVERLCGLARAWRDRDPTDPEAIAAHSEMTWLTIRCELRLSRAERHHAEGADPMLGGAR